MGNLKKEWEPFTYWTWKALQENGITNIYRLRQRTADELLALHKFGPKRVAEVRSILHSKGFTLKGETDG